MRKKDSFGEIISLLAGKREPYAVRGSRQNIPNIRILPVAYRCNRGDFTEKRILIYSRLNLAQMFLPVFPSRLMRGSVFPVLIPLHISPKGRIALVLPTAFIHACIVFSA